MKYLFVALMMFSVCVFGQAPQQAATTGKVASRPIMQTTQEAAMTGQLSLIETALLEREQARIQLASQRIETLKAAFDAATLRNSKAQADYQARHDAICSAHGQDAKACTLSADQTSITSFKPQEK